MTLQIDVLSYSITLPASTDPKVIEWFQFINAYGDLTAELVKLVQNCINLNNQEEPVDFSLDNIRKGIVAQNADLLDCLYNYNASNSAIFLEEKKEKKRMLSV